MCRRARLASTACTLATAGRLADGQRRPSGQIRFGRATGRLHDAGRQFVRGGLGGSPSEDPHAAWLFSGPPPSDVSVFTDALGAETRRRGTTVSTTATGTTRTAS